jgi:methylmalonyl-CoA mutase
VEKTSVDFGINTDNALPTHAPSQIIPPARVRYLAEIAETIAQYDTWVDEQSEIATKLYQLDGVMTLFDNDKNK